MKPATPTILAALILAFGLALEAAAQEPPQATTLIVVRHAEKGEDDPRDPALSDIGRARAAALATSLAAADVAAVYATQYRRTRETGRAVAERAGARLVVVPVQGDVAAYADALLEQITGDHAGRTVLVVGHSNTVPALVRAATGVDVGAIRESDHGRMYVVRTDGVRGSVVVAAMAADVGAGTDPPGPVASACSGPEHRQFDFWLGHWTVRGPDGRTAGSSRVTRVSDGCGILEDWSGARGQNGTSLNFYDEAAGEWVQVWSGGGGEILRLRGGIVDHAMVLNGVGPRETPRGTVLDRIRWTPDEDGSVLQEWLTSSDGGETWSTRFAGVYRPAG